MPSRLTGYKTVCTPNLETLGVVGILAQGGMGMSSVPIKFYA